MRSKTGRIDLPDRKAGAFCCFLDAQPVRYSRASRYSSSRALALTSGGLVADRRER